MAMFQDPEILRHHERPAPLAGVVREQCVDTGCDVNLLREATPVKDFAMASGSIQRLPHVTSAQRRSCT
jgi:hypothetical protein